MTGPLVDRFDALLFDLDGVVYVGPAAVPFAADVIGEARGRGVACAFVTNNAARTAATVAEHLTGLGVPARDIDVITSPQAAVVLLPTFVPAGSRVLVIGGDGIVDALARGGYVPVRHLADGPAAVMQGYSPDIAWHDLAEATFAVRTGIPWIATNLDLTLPTSRGVAPGNGALVQIVAQTAGRWPDAVAGKPEPPLLHAAVARTGADRPLMVGDRLDTDIAAGSRVGIPTLLVFTGVATIGELLRAIPEERPDYLGYDLRVLLEEYPGVTCTDSDARCGDWVAVIGDRTIVLSGPAGTAPWDALRAAAALSWRCADRGVELDLDPVVAWLTGIDAATVDRAGYGGLST